jgi:two-component system sensor histidine kinase TtrS
MLKKIFVLALLVCDPVVTMATTWFGVSEPPIVIGALRTNDLQEIPSLEVILLDRLRREIHPRQAVLEHYSREELLRAVKNRSVNFLVTDAAFFSSIENPYGAKALAAIINNEAADVGQTAASVVFVSASEPKNIKTLHDVRGYEKVLLNQNDLGAVLFLRHALYEKGENSEAYFAKRISFAKTLDLVEYVLKNPRSAGVLPACSLEYLERQGLVKIGTVRVLSPQKGQGLDCLRSTALYPGWTLSAMPGQTQSDIRKLAYVALSTLPSANLQWTLPPQSFREVHNALIDLHEGPYAQTSDWVLVDVLDRYRNWVIGALLLIAAVLFHSIIVGRLVRIRTRDLEVAHTQQQKMANDIMMARSSIENMQKMLVVSYMSSIVAHELKQPIGAIKNFVLGLKFYSEAGKMDPNLFGEALSNILEETERASDIVSRVREYAKNKKSDRHLTDISDVVREAVELFNRSQTVHGNLEVHYPDRQLMCLLNEWEIQLVLYNLIKNAAEAQLDFPDEKILIAIEADDLTASVRIRNHGRHLTEADVESIFKPFVTTKAEGLGLGLSIAFNVVESHGGRLRGEPAPDGGLIVTVELPLASIAETDEWKKQEMKTLLH